MLTQTKEFYFMRNYQYSTYTACSLILPFQLCFCYLNFSSKSLSSPLFSNYCLTKPPPLSPTAAYSPITVRKSSKHQLLAFHRFLSALFLPLIPVIPPPLSASKICQKRLETSYFSETMKIQICCDESGETVQAEIGCSIHCLTSKIH